MDLSLAEMTDTMINTNVRKTQVRDLADSICNRNVNSPY